MYISKLPYKQFMRLNAKRSPMTSHLNKINLLDKTSHKYNIK